MDGRQCARAVCCLVSSFTRTPGHAGTVFQTHTRTHPPHTYAHRNTLRGTPECRKLYTGLYITVAFLLIRNTFRFAEFAQVSCVCAGVKAECGASTPCTL